jgi:hypothetical protein
LTVAVRSPLTPAVVTASSALSELTALEPPELASCRSVVPAGGVKVRAALVP